MTLPLAVTISIGGLSLSLLGRVVPIFGVDLTSL
jgi:hypothetical protein